MAGRLLEHPAGENTASRLKNKKKKKHMISAEDKHQIFTLFMKAENGDAVKADPVLYVIAGGIGAGKTTFRKERIKKGRLPETAVLHDPDSVMTALPGYNRTLEISCDPAHAFSEWEMPARMLAEEILSAAIWMRRDVIYERSCALDTAPEFLRTAREGGYRIDMALIHTDIDTAIARARHREEIEGRHTPPDLVRERHTALLNLWPQYRDLADNVTIYDNSDSANPFQPVFTATGEDETVYADGIYRRFFCANN